MRIALVTYALEIGGVEAVLANLGAELRRRGHEVACVETESRGRWSDRFREAGYAVHTLPRSLFRSRRGRAYAVARVLGTFDAVILNDAPLAQAALGLLPARCVVISVLHMGLDSMVANATGNAGQWHRVVCVNPGLREMLVRRGVRPERACFIANGVAPRPWRARTREPGAPLRVVCLGRVAHEQKGVLHLPGILRLCRDVKLRLDIVGDGPDTAALAAALAADSRAVLHGALSHDAAMAVLRQADVLLMPSYYEGLPVVLLEAMMRGVAPVVSRLAGGTEAVIDDDRSGLFAAPGDEAAFAACLRRLAGDGDCLARLSEGAWRVAYDRFSSVAMADAYEAVLRQCRGEAVVRSARLDAALLGDLPALPEVVVRPVRKTLKLLGLWRTRDD